MYQKFPEKFNMETASHSDKQKGIKIPCIEASSSDAD